MPTDPRNLKPESLLPFTANDPLSDPEKLLEAHFSSSTVGLGIVDANLRYLSINDALAAMNGLRAADHLGKTVREILGGFADVAESKLRHVFTTGESVSFEISAMLPYRRQLDHWLLHYLPIRDVEGMVTRVAVIVVGTNVQKELEESLQDVGGKLRAETGRLEVLLGVSSLLSSNWDVHKLFPKISARIRRLLHHELASFALFDPGTGLLIRQSFDFPLGKGYAAKAQIRASDSPAGVAMRARTPMIFSDEQIHGFGVEISNALVAEGIKSLCCVPLLRPGDALGVFVLGSTRRDAFQSEDLTLLNQVAAQLAIAIENHRAAAEIGALKQHSADERKYLEGESASGGIFSEIIGDSLSLKQVLEQVEAVARSEATVLVLGETGTGKELIARAIHRMSLRKDGSFIKLNCAAIPTGLLESELFGHEKGAFTGAVSQKIGRMEMAHGGTLFLDEVGEIPIELQPKLLRVLQDQEFERLGSNRTIKVNVRLIAATNRDLAKGMAENEFRSDLFYRLSVFPVRMPSLRERREDIPLLVRYFVRKFAQRMNRHIESVPKATMKALMEWSWPGNIRELENLMERSVILSEGKALRVPLPEIRIESPQEPATDHTLDSAEREHILRVLRETGGVLSGPHGAARRLGLKRTTLQSKMKRLKITRHDY